MSKLMYMSVNLIDKYTFVSREVSILKETPKTYEIEVAGFWGRMLRKDTIGKVTEGNFIGSFKVFCFEEEMEEAEKKLKERLVNYYKVAYDKAKFKIDLLKEAGLY